MFSKIGSNQLSKQLSLFYSALQLSVYSLTSLIFFILIGTQIRRPKPQVRNEINQCTGCTVVTRYLTRNPRSKSRKELIMSYLSLSHTFIGESNDCKCIFTTVFEIEFITYSNGHLIYLEGMNASRYINKLNIYNMDKPSAHSDQARKSQYINQIIAF